MKIKSLFLLFIILLCTQKLLAKEPILTESQLLTPPPKIIRTCCSFGVDLKLGFFPLMKFTDVADAENLGQHHFLGHKTLESSGIIYTKSGGFVDIGHARDMADWTGFLYNLILKAKNENGQLTLKLGNEGGPKKLNLTIPTEMSKLDMVELAGKIAYDLSVWHEIATWYGTSFIPLVPERYSAFSVEDAYSNLMGVRIGMDAILSESPYEEAVTNLLIEKVKQLKPVQGIQGTVNAMNEVKEIWWTDKEFLPSGKVLLKREFKVYEDYLTPQLLPSEKRNEVIAIPIPKYTLNGQNLDDFYAIEIKLNLKFPVKRVLGDSNRIITQKQFKDLIFNGTSANRKKYPIDLYQF